MPPRSEYVIDGGALTSGTRVGARRQAPDIVSGSITHAETDIPWHKRGDWPADVVEAGDLLRGLFVPDAETHGEYVQTGVQPVDEATREAFIAFAPYAYDCTLWGPEGELASVNDEGTSAVVALTLDESAHLRSEVGQDGLVTRTEWRRRHSSGVTRLWRRLTNRR